MKTKVRISKCYLVQITDADGYEITSEYVFGDREEAERRGAMLKNEVDEFNEQITREYEEDE